MDDILDLLTKLSIDPFKSSDGPPLDARLLAAIAASEGEFAQGEFAPCYVCSDPGFDEFAPFPDDQEAVPV